MSNRTSPRHRHTPDCGCLAALNAVSRRGFLGMGAGAGFVALAGIPGAFAAYGESEYMLLSCMDPRLVHEVHEYMEAKNLRGQYSQVAIAGGPVAVIAPAFKKWQVAIWENLGATIKLHNIKRVFGLTHRDCGAFKIAYGEAALSTPDKEQQVHTDVLRAFRKQVLRRHPGLGVTTGIMALNGSVELIDG
ncbi:MAG: hypothetical protein IT562_18200 [Alphaproteobacteria bacterium]|nr:hypothetical protein [Alphaproteobacteria bacterium]